MPHVRFDSLSAILQLAVHPAVPLLGDEQRDDVSLLEADQCAVVAGSVGEDCAHSRPLHHIVEARGDGHAPGQVVVLAAPVVWEREEGRKVRRGGACFNATQKMFS